jgi:hypothetical protein
MRSGGVSSLTAMRPSLFYARCGPNNMEKSAMGKPLAEKQRAGRTNIEGHDYAD